MQPLSTLVEGIEASVTAAMMQKGRELARAGNPVINLAGGEPDFTPVPQRKRSHLLARLTRLFVGPELDFDVQLVLNRSQVPDWPLGQGSGAGPRLGWNVWLCSAPPGHDPDDAAFDGGPLCS